MFRLVSVGVFVGVLAAQTPVPTSAGGQVIPGDGRSADGIWQLTSDRSGIDPARRRDIAGTYAVANLNVSALAAALSRAPLEDDRVRPDLEVVITLPFPDGTFNRFRIEESPILAPELASAFPEIKTYRGRGLDDPTATVRFDWTQDGLHAAVISAAGTVYIDPYSQGDLLTYVSYDTATFQKPAPGLVCQVGEGEAQLAPSNALPISHGATRRTLRLALAATGEYTAQAGGTKSAALARMTTTMNRVNGVFERDLSVHFTMSTGTVADPTILIYTNASTDPYTNTDASITAAENQLNLDAVVGNASYDIGHAFVVGNGLGGAASFYACATATKGKAASGNTTASGDYFDVNTVVHEMGHQFGANHTFNGTSGNCGAFRVPLHAYEPGGGSTPMGYNFVCGEESPQVFSGDYFHVESLNEITSFLTSIGSSCGVASGTNAVPTVTATGNFIIPQGTPFTLTALGSDADGDPLTYTWEQYDLGASSNSAATASTDDGTRPLFRSYPPTTNPSRTFPSLQYILNNANVPPQTYSCLGATCLTGEVLPSTNRTMTFQVTARDNRSGGGAIATASRQVTVTTAAGPFAVTAPNTPVGLTGNTVQTIAWSVAGTNVAPINASNVKISLSVDGGLTFPAVLAASAPNTGAAAVALPNTPTTSARVKVEAVGNIFFDISNTSASIVPGPAAVLTSASPNTAEQRRAGLAVAITGQQTHFVPGQTAASFGPGVVVNSTTIVDGTHAIVNVTIAGNAGPGSRTVILTTGGEVAALNSGFSVERAISSTSDFDGDGRADVTVFRPSTGTWYIRNSLTGLNVGLVWGGAGDVPVAGDYDGDGLSDMAVFRPSNGTWYLRSSINGSMLPPIVWGGVGDVPAPGDYDGDGKTDAAVFRPSNGTWYVRHSSTGALFGLVWGGAGDVASAGDYDGDGLADLAVFRPSNGTWYLRNSTTGALTSVVWGGPGDIAVPGDYDADGRTDTAVFRGSTGIWYIRNSSTGLDEGLLWGGPGDVPVPGDYDGDGKTDMAVFRPSTGTWYLRSSINGTLTTVVWGGVGDVPILQRP